MLCYYGYKTDNGQCMRMLHRPAVIDAIVYVEFTGVNGNLMRRPVLTDAAYNIACEMTRCLQSHTAIADRFGTTMHTLRNAMANYKDANRSSDCVVTKQLS